VIIVFKRRNNILLDDAKVKHKRLSRQWEEV